MNKHSKSGVAKVLVLVVVALVAAVGVYYFTSDVGKTRIQETHKQYAYWTPENIAKNPELYLAFCETEAEKALTNLKASEIAVAQNRATLQNTLNEASTKVGVGEKALADLKALYGTAEASAAWPISWQGRSLDAEGAKRQIVALFKQVESQKGLKAKVEAGLKKLEVQVDRIQEGRTQTQGQIAEIKTSREILKVQKLTEDLTDRLSSIKGVLQATIDTASETSGPMSLDQLAEQSAGVVDDSEFNAIMGK
jgi:hypothetical protein